MKEINRDDLFVRVSDFMKHIYYLYFKRHMRLHEIKT